ncbi:MAG TPA: hypothetical protein VHT93_16255 [Pseudolabrys sp.]|nr:hypothetical protein [Pseudolabrys sp.]
MQEINLRAGVGYFVAVTASAATHGLIALAHGWMTGAASSVPMPERAWQMLIMSALIACLFAYVAVFLAFPSVALTYYVAKRFQIRHIAYYAMCGCLASIAYLPIVLSLLERLAGTEIPYTEQAWARYVEIWTIYCSPCIVGAIVFWAIAGRTLPAVFAGLEPGNPSGKAKPTAEC